MPKDDSKEKKKLGATARLDRVRGKRLKNMVSMEDEVFCRTLAKTGSNTKAYLAFKPDCKWNADTIRTRAWNIAKKPHIFKRTEEIRKELRSKMARKDVIAQDRVLLEIARIAFSDPRKAFDGNQLKDVQDWPDDVAASIQSIKVTSVKGDKKSKTEVSEIKFWDKGKQLELASRHLGLLVDKVHHIGGFDFRAMSDKDIDEELLKIQVISE